MGVCLRVSKQEQISEQLNQSLCKQEVRKGYIIRRGGSLCWGCGRYVVSSSLSKVYRSQEDFKKKKSSKYCKMYSKFSSNSWSFSACVYCHFGNFFKLLIVSFSSFPFCCHFNDEK